MDQSQRIPAMPNPVVAAAQEKWMFTDEELERTPTRLDKIEREKEDYIRHRAVEFIWQVSMMLKMPPQTSMTATVLMHRFLMRYSLRGQYPDQAGDLMHPKVIAAVALFVAFKVDETMRRMKDFVVACCRVAMKKPDMVVDEQSKDYWKWRDLILQNESVMLEFLCFDLQLESPYRALWNTPSSSGSRTIDLYDTQPMLFSTTPHTPFCVSNFLPCHCCGRSLRRRTSHPSSIPRRLPKSTMVGANRCAHRRPHQILQTHRENLRTCPANP